MPCQREMNAFAESSGALSASLPGPCCGFNESQVFQKRSTAYRRQAAVLAPDGTAGEVGLIGSFLISRSPSWKAPRVGVRLLLYPSLMPKIFYLK